MVGTKQQFVSWLHRSNRAGGISWWGERATWIRHATYWLIALGLLSATIFDDEAGDGPTTSDDLVTLLWLVIGFLGIAVASLIYTLREWEDVGIPRTVSRSLVLFTVVVAFSAIALFYLRGSGVEINACRVDGERELCSDQASPRQTLGMLVWHAAEVVPVLQITDSFGWERPARSESIVVGAAIVMIRLWVAVGVLAIVKRVWDRWGPSHSASQMRTD
ncbi:MAG: hypothetical protein ACRDJV_03685 [Actinomycetota bacterium]